MPLCRRTGKRLDERYPRARQTSRIAPAQLAVCPPHAAHPMT